MFSNVAIDNPADRFVDMFEKKYMIEINFEGVYAY